MIKIDDRERDLFKRIYDIDLGIFSIYNKFLDLDLTNMKDSEEFSNYLEFLKIAKDVENSLYNELNLDYDKACIIKKRTDYLLCNDDSDPMLARINDFITDIVYPNIKLENINSIDIDYLLNDKDMLAANICKEYLELLIYNYDKYSKDDKYDSFKYVFLSSMYTEIYYSKSIEDKLLKNDFKITMPSKLNVCAYFDLFQFNRQFISEVFDEFFHENIKDAKDYLVSNGLNSVEGVQDIPILATSLTILGAKYTDMNISSYQENMALKDAIDTSDEEKKYIKYIDLKKSNY